MPEKKPDEQEIQQKVMQFQLLERNLQALRGQVEQLAARGEDLAQAKVGLEGMETVKAGDPAFMPLGAGNFVEGKITDASKVLVSTGSDVAVKKTREEALKIVDERLENTKKSIDELVAQERKFVTELQKLQPELQKILHRH